MPLRNWEKVKDTNNYYYLTKESKNDFSEKELYSYGFLKDEWFKLLDEKNDLFPMPESMTKMIKTLNAYRKAMEKYLTSGNRMLKTDIAIIKEDLKGMMSKEPGIGTYEALEMVGQKLAIKDYNEITVFEYYNKIKVFNKIAV